MLKEPKPTKKALVLQEDQLEYIVIVGGHVYGDVENKNIRAVEYRPYET